LGRMGWGSFHFAKEIIGNEGADPDSYNFNISFSRILDYDSSNGLTAQHPQPNRA
jgi:hypothetical protein